MLRTEKKNRCTTETRRGARICELNSPTGTTVSGKGGPGAAPGTEADSPAALWHSPWWAPAAHGHPWWISDGPAAHGDLTLEQVDVPKRGCDSIGSLCWSKLLAAFHDLLGGLHRGSEFLKDCTARKGLRKQQLVKNCSPSKGEVLMLEKFMKGSLICEETGCWSRECGESSP